MTIDLFALARRAGGVCRGRNAFLPGPGHSPADRSLSVTIGDNGRVLWHSFCGDPPGAVRDHLRALGVDLDDPDRRKEQPITQAELAARERTRKALQAQHERQLSDKRLTAEKIWAGGRPVIGSLAEKYLREARGLGDGLLLPGADYLRFARAVPASPLSRQLGQDHHPAMLARIVDADGAPIGLHITYLAADGSGKAKLPEARKIIGQAKGGSIRLGPPQGLAVIAEGVESALSAGARTGLMPVAAISASLMQEINPWPGLEGVLVAHDRDKNRVGETAARVLAKRLHDLGVTVRLLPPPASFGDFNDADKIG